VGAKGLYIEVGGKGEVRRMESGGGARPKGGGRTPGW